MRKKISALLFVLMVGFTLISCDKVDDIIIDDVPKLNIVDAGLNDDNELIFELSDGTLINVGDITGQTGEQGIPGVEGIGIKLIFINDEKKLIVTLTDDTTFDLGVVVGNDGVSITGASLDLEGNLILTLSNGTEINAGLVMGKDGLPGETGEQGIPGVAGVGIKSIEINAAKKLIVTLTNNEVLDLGVVVGNDGQDGVDGREVEFNVSDTHIEWRYVGEETWNELIDLDLLKGAAGEAGSNGTDGREVVIEIVDNEIVWRYEGEEDYHSLIDLEDLKGKDGNDGSDGKDGLDGISVVDVTINEDGHLILTLSDDTEIDAGKVVGKDGVDGLSAYQIYLKYNVNYNKTEAEWLTDLVRGKLSDSDTLDVLTYEQLLLAISSGETKIQLQNNIFALETVKFTSLVNINFNGYTLNGNLDVVTEEFGIMNITGKGTLTGNFRIDAINATLNSDLNVDGKTIIDNIAPLTFNTTGIHKLGIEVKSSGRINIQGLASETTVTINTLVGKNVTVTGAVKKIIVTGQGDVTLISAIVKFIEVETKTNFNISQGSIIEEIEGIEAGIDSLIVISEDSVIPILGESNNIGNIVLDSHTKIVTNKTQLESALANSNITHIYINGTIGSEDSYTIYTLNRDNVTIKGLNEAKVYGTFIIKANSITVEDLSIQNQGNLTVNGSTPSNEHRSGIYVWSNSITLRNNIFTNGLGGQPGLSNAVQVMASEDVGLDVFVIEGNQFIGHDNEVPNWSSSGLVFVQGYRSGTLGGEYGNSIEGNKSDYDRILSSNTFTNNAHDLTHQDWLTGLKVLYPFVAVNETKDEGYHSIQEALNDAATGDTIKLNSDVELKTKGLIIGTDKEITLDLAGYVISGVLENVGASALIANNGSLTIEDSSTDKTGKITNQAKNPDNEWEAGFPAYANNTITNSGNLIINGGRIENTTDGRGASYVIDNNSGNRDAVVIVNEGHIINPNGNFAIRQFANSTVNKNSVTINGGIVEGTRAVWIQLPGSSGQEKLAELTVNGGTLKSTDKGEGGYNLAVYSYTFGDSFAKTKITITGGTFDGDVALTGGSPKAPMETVEVSNEAIFLGQRGVFSYANVVNETQNNGYTTIQAAIDAATAGDTILVAEGTYLESLTIPSGKEGLVLKSVSGADATVINGNIALGADNITIEGFTIGNSDARNGYVGLERTSGSKIINNIINGSKATVSIGNTTGNTVDSVTIEGNRINGGTIGLYPTSGSTITISNNTINSGNGEIIWIHGAEFKPTSLTLDIQGNIAIQEGDVITIHFKPVSINGVVDELDMISTIRNDNEPVEVVLGWVKTVGATDADFTTIQAAIDAAADGDTIQIAAGTYDESVVVPEEKVRSITILGANSDTIPTSSEVDGTIITGGMTFGRDISTNPTIEKSITVKGITFSGGSGLIFKDIRNVTVENNKFIGINAGDAAVTVLDPSPNDRAGVTTISNNYIDGVSGLGIYVRRPAPTTVIEGNHVENTDHNSIQVVGVSAGPDVTITGNTLINWDQNRDADGGRAIRINFDPVDDSTALTVTGNTFLPNDDAEPTDPDYVKITGVSTADNNVNNLISSLIDQNTWPSETEYGTVILVNETTGPVASITSGSTTNYYPTIQAAIDAAEDGDTIQIAAGTYDESIVVPEEKGRITILGADGSIVVASVTIDGVKTFYASLDQALAAWMVYGGDITLWSDVEL